ncbi:MBL fold metallo-hydrolase [Lacticaseibacillus paracasei]|uniref:MBL fold metallo-hydrolase n=1 Tax=Lacticaseibacillus paracasei TaxID=1597 RepID=UPI000FF20B61|nr:MBL fold metallo-hydrolase [Lacticaseibacillus paracasei]RWZ64116.1 MBL fold metallo-hydrolase [Lacticaseibacillus paracasei]
MRLRKKLYQVSGAVYGFLGSAYIVQYSNGYILIDSSRMEGLNTIRKNLTYWRIPETQITHVLLTHGHDDHSGCAGYFQQQGAKVYLGKQDVEMVERGDLGEESPFTNHIMPRFTPDVAVDTDIKIKIGNLTVFAYMVPGHTNGSVIYALNLDNEQLLFTGDTFFADGETGSQAYTGWKGDLNFDSQKLRQSFAKIWALKLNPDIILGGHGIPRIGNDAKNVIQVAYKYFLVNNR